MNMQAAYRSQKSRAKFRGIEWLFTFETWLAVWQASGHCADRGVGVGCYCMARRGDVGPYSPENVDVVPYSKNAADAKLNRPESTASLSARAIGRGRGWAFARGAYQVTCARRYIGRFRTQGDAEQAYAQAVAARSAELERRQG